MSKCSSCMFRGVFRDHGALCDVCTVQKDLVKAIKAIEDHSSDSPCDYFITKDVLIELLRVIKSCPSETFWIKEDNKRTCGNCGFYYFSNNDDFAFCPSCGFKIVKK